MLKMRKVRKVRFRFSGVVIFVLSLLSADLNAGDAKCTDGALNLAEILSAAKQVPPSNIPPGLTQMATVGSQPAQLDHLRNGLNLLSPGEQTQVDLALKSFSDTQRMAFYKNIMGYGPGALAMQLKNHAALLKLSQW